MIGLFGGTFDPIHNGHLRAMWEVYHQLQLDALHLIPAAIPPHRQTPAVSAAHRLAMLQCAIKGLPGNFLINDCELQRQGPSYTLDTLDYFKETLDQTLCLIIGMDAFLSFTHWHRWQTILERAHLIVMQRPDYTLPNEETEAGKLLKSYQSPAKTLRQSAAGAIVLQTVTELAISATAIRQSYAENDVPHFLVPNAVLHYIKTHQLYGPTAGECL